MMKALGQRLNLGKLRHRPECRSGEAMPTRQGGAPVAPSQEPQRQGRYRGMRPLLRVLVVSAVVGGTLLPATAAFAYSHVSSSYWDYTAITYVATNRNWMRDYGATYFKPGTMEIRKFLARALVRAFVP